MGDPRCTRAWRKLRDQVVDEEPTCRLRFPGICTGWSETADHIIPVEAAPELAMDRDNLRGVCHACNLHRGARPLEAVTRLELAPDALAWFE